MFAPSDSDIQPRSTPEAGPSRHTSSLSTPVNHTVPSGDGNIPLDHDDSSSSSSEDGSEDAFGGYESSDEEDFRMYDHDTPSWQQGLSAMDQLAEEFDIESVLHGMLCYLLFSRNRNLIFK